MIKFYTILNALLLLGSFILLTITNRRVKVLKKREHSAILHEERCKAILKDTRAMVGARDAICKNRGCTIINDVIMELSEKMKNYPDAMSMEDGKTEAIEHGNDRSS